jgi:lipopolysaccharide transport system ATP-binding protein
MSDNAIEVNGLSKLYYLNGRRPQKLSLLQRTKHLIKQAEYRDEEHQAVAEGRAFWALRDVNLSVPAGEVLGIIGRNGAGKSTLLKILSRITAPTSGQALIRGSMVSLLEVGTGFHDELTGRENIYLNGTILGMRQSELSGKFDEIVAFSGIERFLDTPVKHYSSGMRVRLGFSVAAHVEPDILVIDEVLAVGDLAFQEKCLQKVDALTQDRSRTVVFVSHSMSSVASLCPRAIRMDSGAIVDDGASGEVISRYYGQEHQGTGIDLASRQDRLGSGIARFTACHLESQHGQQVGYVRSGDPATVVLRYECSAGYDGPADLLANIVFSNSKGVRLFGVPTDAIRRTEGQLWAKGRLVCRIPGLPLMPGNYELDIALIRNRELVDKIMGAATITVVEGDPYGTGALPHPHFGDVVIPYSWDYEPELKAVA